MRGLALAIGVILLPATVISAGGREDDRAAIRRAFETAFDQSRPMAVRHPLVEDRDALRATPPIAARYGAVKTEVERVRVYGGRAQVQFQFFDRAGKSLGNPVQFGIAVQKRNRWLVSRFTLCGLLDFGGDPCPDASPRSGYLIGEPFHPKPAGGPDSGAASLTLPDGTGMAVTVPDGFDLSAFTMLSQAGLDYGSYPVLQASYRPQTVPALTRYAGPNGEPIALDYRGFLNFPLGDWIARIDAGGLSEGDRAFLARHVHINVASDGMFEYIGSQELPLKPPHVGPFGGPGRAAPLRRPAKGVLTIGSDVPQLAFRRVSGSGEFVLARTDCNDDGNIRRPIGTSPTYHAGQRCFPGTGLELGVEGFDSEPSIGCSRRRVFALSRRQLRRAAFVDRTL